MLPSSELPKKQTELRTKSGKRRIQPAFIASVTVPEAEITAVPTSADEPTSNRLMPYEATHFVSTWFFRFFNVFNFFSDFLCENTVCFSYEPAQASSIHLLASPSKSSGRILVSSVEKVEAMPRIDEPMDTHPPTSKTEQVA